MDAIRFDFLSKTLAIRLNRRQSMKALGASGAAALSIAATNQRLASAQSPVSSPVAEGAQADFLFTQLFQSGTAEHATDVANVYRLTLVQNPLQTLYFAERPSRTAGMVPTDLFFDWLNFDPNDPPNAAFVTATADDQEYIAVVQLTNPQFQQAENTISYDVTVIDTYTGDKLSHFSEKADNGELPATFAASSLFIDQTVGCSQSGGICGEEQTCCPPLTCQFDGKFGYCQ